jgi:hypothetical protein
MLGDNGDPVQHVPLNDYLNKESNWPKRLLGWEPYAVKRDEVSVATEYNKDRYTPLLKHDFTCIEDYKIQEFANLGMALDESQMASIGDEIFSMPLRTVRMLWYAIIRSSVERFATGRVCELGCGYGFNLAMLGNDAYGGEYSKSAIIIARRLGMDVTSFNYYSQNDYTFIRDGATVLTVHSIEQLPSAESVLSGLERHSDRIREVIHIEPCWLEERATLMGFVRNRYNELMDHNHDLIRLLRSRQDIEILHFEPDIFGAHPLNSSHLVVWRFRR